jgi:CPA2 family monovalent cation:H+ antiporter-2
MPVTAPSILEIGGLLLIAAAAGWLARRAGLPAVVGYLVVGVAVSPFTPGFVADRTQLHLLADVGVVLLLFEVGIEVDLPAIGRRSRGLLWAAPAQTLLTTGIAAAAALVAGLPPLAAATVGVSIAISSSVAVVNIIRSRRRTTDRATEETLLAWAVLQDLTGVALAALLVAGLAPGGHSVPEVVVGFALFVAVAALAAWILPRVLRALRAEHDLFLIVSVASGLALAGAGDFLFGVPLGLGAFVAGLVITESDAAAEARQRLQPFRDLFAVLFFVGIGTLIDPGVVLRTPGWLLLLVALVIGGKVGVVWAMARLARVGARPLQLAIGLGHVGEFSFVLGSAALAAGVLSNDVFVALLATTALTIGAAAVAVRLAGRDRGVSPAAARADASR